MLDILYLIAIAPLESCMRLVLEWGADLTGSYGWAILLMSLVINTVMLPVSVKAEGWQAEERALRDRMAPCEAMLRRTFKGQERFVLVSAMRRIYGYSGLMTLRASVGLLLQVPFFFAAYHLLSNMDALHGQGFGPLADLGSPDGLLWGLNLMPILMTAANFASAFVYAKGFGTRDKVQLYGMAALFLVLLYDAPAALTFYWTLNNVYSLGRNAVWKEVLPRFRGGASRAKGTGFPRLAVVALILYCCIGVYGVTVQDDVPHKDMVLALFSMGIFGAAMGVVGRGRPAGLCASWPALIPLACCLPLLNTWHANVHMLSMEDILVSSAVLAVLLALVWLGSRVLMGLMVNRWFRLPEPMFMAVFSLFASAALIFWSVQVIKSFTSDPSHFIYIYFFLTILIFLILKVYTISRVNRVIFSLCIMLSCLIVTKYFSICDKSIHEQHDNEISMDVIDNLKEKPNIYLYILESYASLDLLENFWKCDVNELKTFLSENNFQKFHVFSNGYNTLNSFYKIYSMNMRPLRNAKHSPCSLFRPDFLECGQWDLCL